MICDWIMISKKNYFHSAKDRSENVMVVDLVRNDLSKICKEGSVHVNELYGIYTFPQVHQMISTLAAELMTKCTGSKLLKQHFRWAQ